jgi:hypothetical protein
MYKTWYFITFVGNKKKHFDSSTIYGLMDLKVARNILWTDGKISCSFKMDTTDHHSLEGEDIRVWMNMSAIGE